MQNNSHIFLNICMEAQNRKVEAFFWTANSQILHNISNVVQELTMCVKIKQYKHPPASTISKKSTKTWLIS